MFIVDAYDQSKKKEGTWGDFSGASFKVASIRSTEYVKALDAELKPFREMEKRKIKVDLEEQEKAVCRAIAKALLLDWKDVYDSKGNLVEYSVEAATNAVLYNETLREFVVDFAADIDNFRKEDIEEISKK